jgi:regulator of cell morphogenesis and NO signaling
MNHLDVGAPIGEWVAARPARARVFERFGLDYCCGGRVPLDRACGQKGLDLGAVLHELTADEVRDAEPDEPDWTRATMGELADHIVSRHHEHLRRELPRLAALAEKVADAHGAGHPELREARDVLLTLKGDLEFHMLKEEKVFFPIIKRFETAPESTRFYGGSVARAILVMENEHDDAGAALTRLRALTGDYRPPADACNTYRALLHGLAELEADLHRHVHKENSILFPRACAAEEALLGAAGPV